MPVTDQQWLDHSNQNIQEFSNRQIMLKGTVSPPGALPAPIGAFYKNQVNGDRYEKTGPADTDWTLFGVSGTPADDAKRIVDIRNCDASLTVGDLVWESTTIANGVDECTNNTDKRRVIGVCVQKVTDTTAEIMFRGALASLINLSVGDKVYCSPAGTITSTLPSSGYVQVLGDAYGEETCDFSPSHMQILRS